MGNHHSRSNSRANSRPNSQYYGNEGFAPPSYNDALAGGAQPYGGDAKKDPGMLSPQYPSQYPPASGPSSAPSGSSSNPFRGRGAGERATTEEKARYLRQGLRQDTIEDALELLRKFDTVVIVDDSASMRGQRWAEAREALAGLATEAAKYDTDGIDITFLNDKSRIRNARTESEIRQLFNKVTPRAATPIGARLEELMLTYVSNLEWLKTRGGEQWKTVKPVNYIILTDGAPTDEPKDVIIAMAKRLDSGNYPLSQLGIQFVQIGNDRNATEYLEELDNALEAKHDIRDIVDTTPYIGELNAPMLIKVLLGGINRRVDKKGGHSVMV